MAGADGDDRLARDPRRRTRRPRPARRAGSASTSRSRRPSRPALHDGDGWIDFGPAGGSYYYSRTAMTARARSTLDGATLDVDGHRLVRPPVGRLHLGRRRRLGLVRGQPRRRHGPHPVARARRRRHLPARLRHARRPGRDASATSTGTPSPSRSPTAGRAPRPAPTTRPAGRSRSRARPGDQADADGRRPGARHARHDRRRLLGGLAGRRRDPGGEPLGGEAYVELTGYAASRGCGELAGGRHGPRPRRHLSPTCAKPPLRSTHKSPRSSPHIRRTRRRSPR